MKHRESKQQFETGAQRDDATLKGRPSLISAVATYRKAIHLEKGEQHYGSRNWEKGMPFSRCADSLIRHIIQWLAGDKSEDHLAAIACNADFLMHYEAAIAAGKLSSDLDDRPDHVEILEDYLTSLEPLTILEAKRPVGIQCDPDEEYVCFQCHQVVPLEGGHVCPKAQSKCLACGSYIKPGGPRICYRCEIKGVVDLNDSGVVDGRVPGRVKPLEPPSELEVGKCMECGAYTAAAMYGRLCYRCEKRGTMNFYPTQTKCRKCRVDELVCSPTWECVRCRRDRDARR